jgi:hypothetical protein
VPSEMMFGVEKVRRRRGAVDNSILAVFERDISMVDPDVSSLFSLILSGTLRRLLKSFKSLSNSDCNRSRQFVEERAKLGWRLWLALSYL